MVYWKHTMSHLFWCSPQLKCRRLKNPYHRPNQGCSFMGFGKAHSDEWDSRRNLPYVSSWPYTPYSGQPNACSADSFYSPPIHTKRHVFWMGRGQFVSAIHLCWNSTAQLLSPPAIGGNWDTPIHIRWSAGSANINLMRMLTFNQVTGPYEIYYMNAACKLDLR